MTNKKLSELSSVSSNELTDLFEISRSTSPSSWDSRSITYDDLLIAFIARTIRVSPAGGHSTSIKDGIAYAVSKFSPSAMSPCVVSVFPGTYYEDPIIIPPYVSVISFGASNNTFIVANSPVDPLITMTSNSLINGFRLLNAFGVSGSAIKVTGTNSIIAQCVSLNCYTGFYSNGAINTRFDKCSVVNGVGQTCFYGFRIDNNSDILASNCNINGEALSMVNYGIYVDNGKMDIFGSYVNYCSSGIYVKNSGVLEGNAIEIEDCTNAINVPNIGSNVSVRFLASAIEESTTYDILIDSPTATVSFFGAMDYNKRSIVNGARFLSLGASESDQIVQLSGETHAEQSIHIGTPGGIISGNDIAITIGDAGIYNKDKYGTEIVEYWKYDASAPSGSRFTRYINNSGVQLSDIGDALIIGSRYPFSALNLDVDVAAVLGSSNIIAEHWHNTSVWESHPIAVYESQNMTHRQNNPFQNVETQFIEIALSVYNDWVADINVLNEIPNWNSGNDFYAIRFRNTTSALTSPMTFSHGAVIGDDIELGRAYSGFNWGKFRKNEVTLVIVSEMVPNPAYPTYSSTTSFSPNVSGTLANSKFIDDAVGSLIFPFILPTWIDTSTPIRAELGFYTVGASLGDVEFKLRLVPIGGGFIADGTGTEVVTSIVSPTYGVPNLFAGGIVDVDISDYPPGQNFAASIERDATIGNALDTLSDDVVLVAITLNYKRKSR